MVSIKAIREANKTIAPKSLTAVFVGATSGIGLGAIEALLQNTTSSTVIIIGRSETKFASTLERLQKLNSSARITFLEAQVSLLKEVERVCSTITSQIESLDLLWLSQGGLNMSAHALTSEGLFESFAISYYSRMLFMQKLTPLLTHSSDARIISILSPSSEGTINTSDFGLEHPTSYTKFWAMQKHGVSMMSLAMKEQALLHPDITFLHTNPGLVATDVHVKWADSMTGLYTPFRYILRWMLIPLMHSLALTPEDAGQVGFYEATNDKFEAGKQGKNFWRLWQDAEDLGEKATEKLKVYESDGTQKKLWEHTLAVFRRVLG
ncbi:Hypothetical protein R9X50_00510900 [Acrodontium crateriforme]|uniref:NAD(P)-binding protein n=1 Tax=Acrodontium crateriforme TaxID=150365 RepID=A0AAQ3M6U4_9PEZI|nr:Hypothetical protein R9X50_00510900 [Acrodontium crateriforme]